MRQFGLGNGTTDSVQTPRETTDQTNRNQRKRNAATDETTQVLTETFPRLRPEDTVVLEVTYKAHDATNATTPNAQTPNQSQNANASRPTAGVNGSGASLTPFNSLTEEEQERLTKLVDLILEGNPYNLDRTGVLRLPSVAPIALLGLSEEQASLRLTLEPQLRGLSVKLTRLPVTRVDVAALKPFGYDLFDDGPSTFAPVTDVPVPAEYILGTGDQLQVQLFGSQNRSYRLVVNRDGQINFPDLGPIAVAGQSFGAVREEIERRVAVQVIGTRASVTMGEVRSIRVFVLGDAKAPGSYLISGLSTITSALYASGGISKTGSLRDIQLKRQGAPATSSLSRRSARRWRSMARCAARRYTSLAQIVGSRR